MGSFANTSSRVELTFACIVRHLSFLVIVLFLERSRAAPYFFSCSFLSYHTNRSFTIPRRNICVLREAAPQPPYPLWPRPAFWAVLLSAMVINDSLYHSAGGDLPGRQEWFVRPLPQGPGRHFTDTNTGRPLGKTAVSLKIQFHAAGTGKSQIVCRVQQHPSRFFRFPMRSERIEGNIPHMTILLQRLRQHRRAQTGPEEIYRLLPPHVLPQHLGQALAGIPGRTKIRINTEGLQEILRRFPNHRKAAGVELPQIHPLSAEIVEKQPYTISAGKHDPARCSATYGPQIFLQGKFLYHGALSGKHPGSLIPQSGARRS